MISCGLVFRLLNCIPGIIYVTEDRMRTASPMFVSLDLDSQHLCWESKWRSECKGRLATTFIKHQYKSHCHWHQKVMCRFYRTENSKLFTYLTSSNFILSSSEKDRVISHPSAFVFTCVYGYPSCVCAHFVYTHSVTTLQDLCLKLYFPDNIRKTRLDFKLLTFSSLHPNNKHSLRIF
jgi:hypothetical protein